MNPRVGMSQRSEPTSGNRSLTGWVRSPRPPLLARAKVPNLAIPSSGPTVPSLPPPATHARPLPECLGLCYLLADGSPHVQPPLQVVCCLSGGGEASHRQQRNGTGRTPALDVKTTGRYFPLPSLACRTVHATRLHIGILRPRTGTDKRVYLCMLILC
eukprot:Hpha_TRINITY_DN15616_c3_g5::TRINITY_DN15616_c3_g5_i1::g.101671::m.101671